VNVRWFDFDLSDVFEMRFEDDEIEEFALRNGDVLICEGGEPGRAATEIPHPDANSVQAPCRSL
jgi:type I restriction enzyme S subunit